MAINFTLSDKRLEDPEKSWAGRPWKGWDPGADPEEIWKNNRGIWRFGDRIENERIATLSWQGEIVVVAAITGIEDIGPEFQRNGLRRRALEGHVLPEGHPVHDALIGQPLPRHRSVLTYHPTPELNALAASETAGAAPSGDTGLTDQGRVTDPELRKAIEDAAQQWLEDYYRDRGWDVEDVRFEGPYDAIARKDGRIRYLEAKGTQSDGTVVTVTAGEVDHARQHPGECVIGILSGLRFTENGELDESAAQFVVRQWNPVEEDLRAVEYKWKTARATILHAGSITCS